MKVSIVTVCYNSERTIEDTIKSVLIQSYKNIEYIIVDGNSKDKTMQIVKEYEKDFAGRMKWISEKDNGLYDAMNKGICMATGDIIGIINSDDFYTNEFVIENVVKKMVEEDADCLYSDLVFVSENNTNRVVRKWRAGTGSVLWGWNPPHPTTFIKKKIYDTYGLYKVNNQISSDYDLLYKIFKNREIRVAYLRETIVKMRMGGQSTRGIKSTIQGNKEVYATLRENGNKIPIITVILRLLRKINQKVST